MTEEVKDLKYFLYSKTLWANALALIAIALQSKYGFIVSVEEQAAAIVLINLVLRAATKKGLTIK